MTAGLQVYNADSTIKTDLTKRYCKVIATMELTGTGQITTAEVGCANNRFWYFILNEVYGTTDSPALIRLINNGKTLKWENLSSAVSICYGVY